LRVAVLGTGLIGGSIGLAARRAGEEVWGYDLDADASGAALELGAIDAQVPDIATAVRGAQVVFAAAPVGVLAETVRRALAVAGSDCVIGDVGSTKLALEEARSDPRFVGGHPLAGAETSGVANAREDLFVGCTWYLTSGPTIDRGLYERMRDLVTRFGARPVAIEPDAHDRLMASVSHLPHVLANVLVTQAAAAFEREGCQAAGGAGPSFRDATRVAGANTAVWSDIYLANREALSVAIDEAVGRLAEVSAALQAGDAQAISVWNEQARADRGTLLCPDDART
jgi:prephenate dehydrogenase